MECEGIRHQRTVPYTPEQNGAAEREMRTIVESARTMLYARQMDLKFWAEAVNAAVFVINRTGTSTVVNKTPYELWIGNKPRFDHLQPFGATVFVHIPKERRRKLDPKAYKGIFVGYDENVKGFRVWNISTRKIQIARDVKFADDRANVIEINIENEDNDNTKATKAVEMVDEDEDYQDAESSIDISSGSSPEISSVLPDDKITNRWCRLSKSNVIEERLRGQRTNQEIWLSRALLLP